MSRTDYVATIGIECHVQLNTVTKLFAGVGNDARDAEPNTLISPLCVGMPGTLPVVNEHAIRLAIRAGLALGADIAPFSKFDRKHYFYPDLPLGYQITQYDEPTILSGRVVAPLSDGKEVQVRIHHAHLEADAGKSTHPDGRDYSLVDLNRAGTPLIEIVSEPDMHTAEEAKAYARELYLLMKFAGVSEANLYYGNMRFDVNVSVSNVPGRLGTRTETKNLNSFRAVEKAVEYEIERQIQEREAGREIIQETRGWDDNKQVTFSQRSKENAHDYRYFPDPDIPPIVISEADVEAIKGIMPTMPNELRRELNKVGVDRMSIEAMLDYPALAGRWNEVRLSGASNAELKKIADWLTNEILAELSKNPDIAIEEVIKEPHALDIKQLIKLAKMSEEGLISSSGAKVVLSEWKNLYDVEKIAQEKDVLQVSDESELEIIVAQVIDANPKASDDLKNGEQKAIGFLVGSVMKATGGKANPSVVQTIIKKILNI